MIKTSYDCPPIPDRGHDWSAVWGHFDPEGNDPQGRGETEADAVLDLIVNSLDDEADQVAEMAWNYWKGKQHA